MNRILLASAFALACASLTSVSGAILFTSVADDLSNVSPNGTDQIVSGGNKTGDNKWGQRDGFGQGGVTVLEGWENETSDEVLPVLTLTLTSGDGIVANSSYDVYVNYIRFGLGTGNERGGTSASLDGVTFTTFNEAAGTAGTVGFAEATGYSSADRGGFRGYLGSATSSALGTLTLQVTGSSTVTERVWFDGASVEAIPEPSGLSLLLLGSLGLLSRRRCS